MASSPAQHGPTLDLSGKFCPQVVLEIADFARHQPQGTQILVISTDPLSTIDVPLFAMKQGHALEVLAQSEAECRFLLTIRPS
ncbi:MAG: sulfurtransferase TusA family protein [Proteobacteria bacterium]|nr:sulfurtransferase TusA family protein [Pseudomonadota bacterium]